MEMKAILIVDDDQSFRTLVRRVLETSAYHLKAAENGVQALSHLRRSQVALLITDLVMPERDGIETIIQARKQHPGLKILALSGARDSDQYLKVASLIGADATLDKSLVRERLKNMVQSLLSQC